MTETQGDQVIALLTAILAALTAVDGPMELLRGAVEYSLTGCFWILTWILASLLWRNFILAKNQGRFLSVVVLLGCAGSVSAQNYQFSAFVLEFQKGIEFDGEGVPESFKPEFECGLQGAKEVRYWVGTPTDGGESAVGESWDYWTRAGAWDTAVVAVDGETKILQINGEDWTFYFVAASYLETVGTDVAALRYTASYTLPGQAEYLGDRAWGMVEFPSGGLNLEISSSAIEDLPGGYFDDEIRSADVEDYEADDAFEPSTAQVDDLEAFGVITQPNWNSGTGVSNFYLEVPGGSAEYGSVAWIGFDSMLSWSNGFFNGETEEIEILSSGSSSQVNQEITSQMLTFRTVCRGAGLIGVVIWFISAVYLTLRQY